MNRSLSSTVATTGSCHVKYKRPEKNPNAEIQNILNKFSIAEQVTIQQNFDKLPESIFSIWRQNFKLLDLQDIQQQLQRKDLHQFLRKMRRHFQSVRFSNQLQDELNLLDRSGIAKLPGVLRCEICCDSAKAVCPQWPLHALPKLLSHLNCLEMHMSVQVGFIGQFSELKSLTLYDEIAPKALAAIWVNCPQLMSVQLLGLDYPNLNGISQCLHLRKLTLPLGSFNPSIAFEILQMSKLRQLQLQHGEETAEKIIEAMALVLRQRQAEILKIQLNGERLATENWLPRLELHRCIRLESLTLINCRFGMLSESKVGFLPVLSRLAFCHCSDLKDNLLLIFVKACPQLMELNLIDCMQLTGKLLHNLCNMRNMESLDGGAPLGLYLRNCAPLTESLKQHFSAHSMLRLLEEGQAYEQTKHVQFIFLSTEST